MKFSEKQPSPATKRKRASANTLTVTRPGQEALSVELAAQSGDYLQTLYALRDRLATVYDECRQQRDKAAIAGRLAAVLAMIEAEERGRRGQSGQSPSNEAAARRSLSEAVARGGGVRDEFL